ncbi:MAG TPA: MarR family transcriptional regulator [Spirochaetota bacterium]|nr:MarR family transcriptional regulator [Spirochaetota bacterium]
MKTEQIRKLRSILRLLNRTLFSCFDETSSCCGVSTSECHVLMELGIEEGVSLTNIAEKLQINPGNMSRTIEKMVQNGLIERRTQPENRRSVSLFLTNAGRAQANEINDSYDKLFKELLSLIDESKHEMIIESIDLLTKASISIKDENEICCKKDNHGLIIG